MRPSAPVLRIAPADLPGLLLLGALVVFLLHPAWALLSHSMLDSRGQFSGLDNFRTYLETPALLAALGHSLTIAAITTLITVLLAFALTYAATHSRMPGRRLCPALALLPLCMPSMLPALGIIYLFGAQGPLQVLLGGQELYGPPGLIMGSVFFCLPHAVLLLRSSLGKIDADLYAAAASLGAGAWRRFFTVTLPGVRYGLISAALVTFTLTLTDFGVPKVLGGSYGMLSTEIYAQVIGQQNISMGATVSLVLLLPTALTVILDHLARRGQARMTLGNGRGLHVKRKPLRAELLGLLASSIVACLLAVCGTVILASFMAFWPYDLTLCLNNYDLEMVGFSWAPLFHSLQLALATACAGTCLLLGGAWLAERGGMARPLAALYRALLMIPLALPGMVLGLAYIFAFNRPGSWSGILYGTLPLLVANTIIHFSTTGHMACVAALARIDPHCEDAGRLLGIPAWRTACRVVLPQCSGAAADLFLYLFLNALTTVSAVVFLCSADLSVASVACLQMYDAGQMGPAAAMGTALLLVALGATFLRVLAGRIFKQTPRK